MFKSTLAGSFDSDVREVAKTILNQLQKIKFSNLLYCFCQLGKILTIFLYEGRT